MARRTNNFRSILRETEALATAISACADLLRPLPRHRDKEHLHATWSHLVSVRRKTSALLKHHIRDDTRTDRAYTRFLNETWAQLSHWGAIDSLLRRQIWATSTPLIAEKPAPSDPSVMDHVVNLSLAALHRLGNPNAERQSIKANERGMHRDIPYPMSSFTQMIGAAHRVCLAQRKPRPLRFLDVGCGGGTKLLAATTCFELCHGLEYENTTAKSAQELIEMFAPETCRVEHGDAFAYEHFGDYDVIYFYRPIADEDGMENLEARILTQAQPGTIICAGGGLLYADLKVFQIQPIAHQVYVTGIGPGAAATLIKDAESMGTDVPGFNRRARRAAEIWEDLLEVSAQNGHLL